MRPPMTDTGTEDAASLTRASATLAAGTLVSRALGFVSIAVLAWAIGPQNPGANAFALANQLPNNIYAIVAAGVLSAVLVPQIVRAGLHADGGQDFVNKLVTLGVVVFAVATVIATLCAPLLVALYTFNSDASSLAGGGLGLAVVFAYWCLPQIFFYAIYSLLGEVLNARGIFGPFTWAPALNNVVRIISLVIFAVVFGVDPTHQDPSHWTTPQIALLAGGTTLGIAAQALVLLAFWRRTGLGFRPDFRWRGVGLAGTARAAGWTFAMIVVTQLAGIVQTQVALTAGASDASVAVLGFAWLIFMLPHGIIAVSIATPYFTRMSGHARDQDLPAVRADLSASLRTIGLLIAGAAAALAAGALPFAAVFARTPEQVVSIGVVLLAFLVGLVPFSMVFVMQRAYYALGDTRTPFLFQLVQSVLFVSGAVAVAVIAPDTYVAAGIALVTSLAGTAQAVVAAILLRRRLGGVGGRRLVTRFGAYLLATAPAAAAGVGILYLLGGLPGDGGGFAVSGRAQGIISVILIGSVSFGVYLGVLALARVSEVREIGALVRRLTGR
jgi:putative peptidoglycan lipid II flippase